MKRCTIEHLTFTR